MPGPGQPRPVPVGRGGRGGRRGAPPAAGPGESDPDLGVGRQDRRGVLVESAFVARAEELRQLNEAFAETPGRGRGPHVRRGESGFGKTRLLSEFGVRISQTGALVLRGRATTESSHEPLEVIDGVAAGVMSLANSRPELEQRLRSRLSADLPAPGRISPDPRSPGERRLGESSAMPVPAGSPARWGRSPACSMPSAPLRSRSSSSSMTASGPPTSSTGSSSTGGSSRRTGPPGRGTSRSSSRSGRTKSPPRIRCGGSRGPLGPDRAARRGRHPAAGGVDGRASSPRRPSRP